MIRVYGMTVGHGSYARVTAGAHVALAGLGLCEGLLPLDAMDDWAADSRGAFAKVAVTVTQQTDWNAEIPFRLGSHERRLMLLPLNSSYCPESMLALTKKRNLGGALVTGWLTPSKWSAEQLRALTDAPVTVWRHGVADAYRPNDERLAGLAQARAEGKFEVLHLSSTTRQRKGTVVLLKAWAAAMADGKLPSTARLTLVVAMGHEGSLVDVALASMGAVASTVRVIRQPLNLADDRMADVYSEVHAVAQPSRGEGFGMVPLEALCCGVPVVATTCSGHSEYLSVSTPGLSAVPHGPDARIDDGPDAVAPSVSSRDVADALVRAYDSWDALASAARGNADALRAEWSWGSVMRQWAAEEGWIG